VGSCGDPEQAKSPAGEILRLIQIRLVIRVCDEDGSVIDTHEQTGEFKESGEAAESDVV
jgi:hypothetical protein